MSGKYQMETVINNFAKELEGKLSKDFPYIDISQEHYRTESSIGVRWPLIKPSEISKLHIDLSGMEIWLTGELCLTPDKAGALGVKPRRLVSYGNNIGIHYGRVPFNIFKLTSRLYKVPFESHTRKTIECREENIRDRIRQTMGRWRELQEKLGLVVENAPLPLLDEYQGTLDQIDRIIVELLAQTSLYQVSLSTIEQQIREGRLPHTLVLEQIRRRQLTSGNR